jgi:hypothetical protein
MVIYTPVISGSLIISGSIVTTSGGLPLTGSLVSSGSFTSIGPTIISGSLTVITGSSVEFQVLDTGVRIGNLASDNHTVTGSLLVSGSITGSGFLTTGTITAQTLVVQTITSSVSNITGSTKFGSLAANTHQFTGSVSVSGSLGIGITGPSSQLHIIGNSGGTFTDGLRIGRNGNTTQYTILNHVGGATNLISVDASGNNIPETYFYRSSNGTAVTSSMMINKDGFVGIGTTNPNTKLQVEDGFISTYHNINANGAGYGIQFFTNGGGSKNTIADISISQDGTTRSGIMLFSTSNAGAPTERMRITSGGNVIMYPASSAGGLTIGAANTAFAIALNFINDANTNGAVLGLARSAGQFLNGAGAGDLIIGNATGENIIFGNTQTGATEYMRITSGGNIGIGTNNPTAQLQVSSASGGIISINSTVTNTFRGLIFQNNAASDGTEYAYLKYNATSGEFRIYANPAAFGGFMSFYSNNAESMRLNASGYLFIGATTNSGFSSAHRMKGPSATETTDILSIDGGVEFSGLFRAVSGANYSNTGTAIIIGRNSSTGRSINAGGTINTSGADYAEYMTKAIEDTIIKGDIIGVNSEGLLTNIFNDSISFVVKSTDPSYVGGDGWGSVDTLGKLNPEANEEEKQIYNTKLEAARAKVDRIAFSGQVPCNVTGAKVGDYIIPIQLENGKIGGQAITNPTFEQYQISVGKVWKIMKDGRAWIAVKIG